MAGDIQQYPAPSTNVINSIQYGTATISSGNTSGTATITSVDTSKAVLIMLGYTSDSASESPREYLIRITLTNATTVTATKNTAGTGITSVVSFVVVEFA